MHRDSHLSALLDNFLSQRPTLERLLSSEQFTECTVPECSTQSSCHDLVVRRTCNRGRQRHGEVGEEQEEEEHRWKNEETSWSDEGISVERSVVSPQEVSSKTDEGIPVERSVISPPGVSSKTENDHPAMSEDLVVVRPCSKRGQRVLNTLKKEAKEKNSGMQKTDKSHTRRSAAKILTAVAAEVPADLRNALTMKTEGDYWAAAVVEARLRDGLSLQEAIEMADRRYQTIVSGACSDHSLIQLIQSIDKEERRGILPPRHCMGMTGNCEWILRPEVTEVSSLSDKSPASVPPELKPTYGRRSVVHHFEPDRHLRIDPATLKYSRPTHRRRSYLSGAGVEDCHVD